MKDDFFLKTRFFLLQISCRTKILLERRWRGIGQDDSNFNWLGDFQSAQNYRSESLQKLTCHQCFQATRWGKSTSIAYACSGRQLDWYWHHVIATGHNSSILRHNLEIDWEEAWCESKRRTNKNFRMFESDGIV